MLHLRLKPGWPGPFRRMIVGELLTFEPGIVLELPESVLPELAAEIERGTLQPVDPGTGPGKWVAIPVEEIDLDAMVQKALSERRVNAILDKAP